MHIKSTMVRQVLFGRRNDSKNQSTSRKPLVLLIAVGAFLVILSGVSILLSAARATSGTIVVGPGNQDATGWLTLEGFFGEAPPDNGTQTYQIGPATPPLGVGSLKFQFGNANPSWSEAVGYIGLNGVGIGAASLTELSYSTYVEQSSDAASQDFFAILLIDTNGDQTADDFLFFFPADQHGCSNGAPTQHTIGQNQWQVPWDARNGVWVSGLGLCNAQESCGTANDPKTLAEYLACSPTARIINDDGGTPGSPSDDTPGLIIGYGGSTVSPNFIGYLDNVKVGTNGMTTTFDFDPCVLTISCPSNVTAVTNQSTCSLAACTVVTFANPVTPANCGATVMCVPPSGSCFATGTTAVSCSANDGMGQTANCSFTVTVFDVCLQDDSNPNSVLLFNSQTGDYRFCCGGMVFTGRGTINQRGCVISLSHNPGDRRLSAQIDKTIFRGSAALQFPPGVMKCTISDRDTRNNSCKCP